MSSYTKRIDALILKEWAEQYLDYDGLKDLILREVDMRPTVVSASPYDPRIRSATF